MSKRVVELTPQDLIWGFQKDEPHFGVGINKYCRIDIDPTPAYPHDIKLVRDRLRAVEKIVGKRVEFKPIIFSTPFEILSRTNGWADRRWDYSDTPSKRWEGYIILSAKRVPIHPSMTRYLVPHEYGHHIEWELDRRKGAPEHREETLREYAKLRKLEFPAYYGPGTWHIHPKEIFANDFRILITEMETEFYPHPVSPPNKLKEVVKWWEENF